MTDDIRQEAVERAADGLYEFDPVNEGRDWWLRHAAVAVEDSGLIDQLTEAIARRDKYREQLAKVVDQRDEWERQFQAKVEDLAIANQAWRDTYEQLAAERALCDRLADTLDSERPDWNRQMQPLVDYDAHRAAERSEAEGP